MQQDPVSSAPVSRPGTRVLIVDDNIDAADTLGDLLRLDGYAPQICYGEEKALATARSDPPEIVILDIGMPERGGHVLARQLRELLPDALIVAFTGFSSVDDIERSVQSGIDEHWVKPMGSVAFAHALATARHSRTPR
ncbi:MAG TPA: response regulator [Casimicrobiaceae bacterium]|nr:response regulator [Casimicrobiaceae bacterium]